MMRARLPMDAAALALGADAVAAALTGAAAARGIALELTRTGSRGMIWLEPLLEIETEKGWRAFGPLKPGDVEAVLGGTLIESTRQYRRASLAEAPDAADLRALRHDRPVFAA